MRRNNQANNLMPSSLSSSSSSSIEERAVLFDFYTREYNRVYTNIELLRQELQILGENIIHMNNINNTENENTELPPPPPSTRIPNLNTNTEEDPQDLTSFFQQWNENNSQRNTNINNYLSLLNYTRGTTGINVFTTTTRRGLIPTNNEVPLNQRRRRTINETNLRQSNINNRIISEFLTTFLDSTLSLSLSEPSTEQNEIATREQIENATRVIKYDNIENPINTCCPIDITPFNNDDYVIQIKHCSHIFNRISISRWFENHSICPVCRFDIRETSASAPLASTPTPTPAQSNHILF